MCPICRNDIGLYHGKSSDCESTGIYWTVFSWDLICSQPFCLSLTYAMLEQIAPSIYPKSIKPLRRNDYGPASFLSTKDMKIREIVDFTDFLQLFQKMQGLRTNRFHTIFQNGHGS